MSEDNGNQQQPQAGLRAENPVKNRNNRYRERERERIEMEETVLLRVSRDRQRHFLHYAQKQKK